MASSHTVLQRWCEVNFTVNVNWIIYVMVQVNNWGFAQVSTKSPGESYSGGRSERRHERCHPLMWHPWKRQGTRHRSPRFFPGTLLQSQSCKFSCALGQEKQLSDSMGTCEERTGTDGDHGEEEKMSQGVRGAAAQTGTLQKGSLGWPFWFLMRNNKPTCSCEFA